MQCPIRKPTTPPYPIGVQFSIAFQFDGEFDSTLVPYNKSNITVYPPPNICFNSSLLTFNDHDLVIQVREYAMSVPIPEIIPVFLGPPNCSV